VLIDKHAMCVLKSVAKPLKKTVASESDKKPRKNVRKLNERFGKIYKWSYIKFTPSGCMWKPKSPTGNVNPNLIEIVPFIIDFGCSKHITGNLKLLINFVEKKSTCFIRDLKGNNLLTGSRATDLYSISLQSISSPSPICLMVKATSSQAWLVQRGLQAQVRVVRTNKGTEFLNQTLLAYFAAEGIQH
nr:integrase, catalytic region, zinc finger, CCHC-type, peptidase aspartic, catalytic [Tanacetum cinerariifolium]